jgi:iron complex outermembrane receptor protein
MIVWLPTMYSYWSPKNIDEVYSRGGETKSELTYAKKDFLVKLILNTAYVLSTSVKSKNENDNAVGRQLIYTPRYNGNGTAIVSFNNFNCLINSNYTGYRFTSTDNTKWLNPYLLTNIKCGYNYSFNSINTELFFGINNAFNKSYTVILNRPMPLRNYEAGIILNYHKKKAAPQTS